MPKLLPPAADEVRAGQLAPHEQTGDVAQAGLAAPGTGTTPHPAVMLDQLCADEIICKREWDIQVATVGLTPVTPPR